MIAVEKNETISAKPKKTQSNRKNAVEHAGDARSQTKRTPNLRRKKRQIAVDSSEILHNWTAILRFVENSTEILLSGLFPTPRVRKPNSVFPTPKSQQIAAPSTPLAARRPATPPPTQQSYGDMLGIVVAALAFYVPDAALSARCVRATAVLLQAGKQDPMRPANPPIEPLIINAIQDMLKESKPDANAIAERALAARSADPDYILADEEATLLRTRIAGVAAASDALVALLHAAVDATPWVTKFGAAKDFGVGELSDPYVRSGGELHRGGPDEGAAGSARGRSGGRQKGGQRPVMKRAGPRGATLVRCGDATPAFPTKRTAYQSTATWLTRREFERANVAQDLNLNRPRMIFGVHYHDIRYVLCTTKHGSILSSIAVPFDIIFGLGRCSHCSGHGSASSREVPEEQNFAATRPALDTPSGVAALSPVVVATRRGHGAEVAVVGGGGNGRGVQVHGWSGWWHGGKDERGSGMVVTGVARVWCMATLSPVAVAVAAATIGATAGLARGGVALVVRVGKAAMAAACGDGGYSTASVMSMNDIMGYNAHHPGGMTLPAHAPEPDWCKKKRNPQKGVDGKGGRRQELAVMESEDQVLEDWKWEQQLRSRRYG
eukprot:scaffold16452_cov116-Isochrysis_galbana.AAC.3